MDRSQRFLARRYAQAFLNVHFATLKVEDLGRFERGEQYFRTHQGAIFLMDLSLLSRETKEKAVQDLVEKFGLPTSIFKLIMLVVSHHRTSLLGFIFHELADAFKEQAQIITFTVQSSQPLSTLERSIIENFLQDQLEGQLFCQYEVTPTLIAGVRIFNEQYLWEYSAQAQLRALAHSVRH